MKFTTSLSLLTLLPSGTNAMRTTSLRGTATAAASSRNLEFALFGKQEHRTLQDTCEASYFKENTLTTCCMPQELDHSLLTANKELKATVQHAVAGSEGETSYWSINFENSAAGGNLAGLDLSGWCVDRSRGLGAGTYTFDVYSTYDDWNFDEALDQPERLVNVNWLINHYHLKDSVTVPTSFMNSNPSCAGSVNPMIVEWRTFQNAVWATIDTGMTSNGIWQNSGANACLQAYLISEADTKGNGFEPDCSDPNAEVAILLVYDDDITANKIKGQVIIGEVKLAQFKAKNPTVCKAQQCCEELVVDHELFQENKEIMVTFASGSTPGAWNVAFESGSSVYPAQQFKAWSVDLDRPDFSATLAVDTYSVYDNWYRFNAVDKKENIPKVNYLINKFPVGISISCGGGTYTVTQVDFQNAVWDLMDTLGLGMDRGSPTACVVSELVLQANENGPNYEPSCSAGSSDKIAILLIVDDGTYKKKYSSAGTKTTDTSQVFETVKNQIIVAEVPLSTVQGSCVMKDCNCCRLDTPAPIIITLPPVIEDSETRDTDNVAVTVSGPSCPTPIDFVGSQFGAKCGHKGVKLIHASVTEPSSPALRVDILDTIMGIVVGSDGMSVDFRVQNPFAGQGSLEMYVQYETGEHRSVVCDADPAVNECGSLVQGKVLEAVCIDPGNEGVQPFTVVTVYFVDRGTKLFPVSYTNNVYECCEPGPITASDSVVSYTFEILCTCPEGTNAFTRD